MDLFDTLIWAEILVKTTFLDTPTLTIPDSHNVKYENKVHIFIKRSPDISNDISGYNFKGFIHVDTYKKFLWMKSPHDSWH
jgi:hypothetical protein